MSDSKLLCTVDDGIATLRINRPEVHNAVDLETMRRIEETMRSMRHDDGVRVIVLTGVGDAAFSSGGDMKEMQSFSAMTGDRLMEAWQAGLDAIEISPKPVICAINGLAYGGGTEIAMACHIRVAVEGASLGQTEIALGHLPGAGGTQRLPRLVPLGFAYEHLLTGETIDAADAHRVGLVNHVWTRETFTERTMDLARRIAARSPDAVRYTLDAVREGLKSPLSVGLRLERALASMVIEGADARRGFDDFFAKRRNARSRNS